MLINSKAKYIFLLAVVILALFVAFFLFKTSGIKKSQKEIPDIYKDLSQCNDSKNNKNFPCKKSANPIDLTAKVKQYLVDYNNAADKNQTMSNLLEAVKERKEALLLAINLDSQLILDLSLSNSEYSSFPKEVQPYLEKYVQLEGKLLLGEAPHDNLPTGISINEPPRVLVTADYQAIILHEINPTSVDQLPIGQDVIVSGIMIGKYDIVVLNGGIKTKVQVKGFLEESKGLLALEPGINEDYCVIGPKWNTTNLTVSFMPDGSPTIGGGPSRLFSAFNAVASTANWQREIAKAFAAWQVVSPLNFHFVSSGGNEQIGAFSFAGSGSPLYCPAPGLCYSGYGWSPPAGQEYFNSDRAQAMVDFGLFYLALHETGHTLGLCHSSDKSAVMYADFGPSTGAHGLTPDDIAGIRAIYGPRQPDSYEPNNIRSNSYPLTVSSFKANIQADISKDDVDWFKVTVPSNSDKVNISVDSSNSSLLWPEIAVYNSSGFQLAKTSTSTYSSAAYLTLNVIGGSTLYIRIITGSSDFNTGLYNLSVQFSFTCKDLNGACVLKGTCSEPFQYDKGQTTDCGAHGLTCCSSVVTLPRVVVNPPSLPTLLDPEVNLAACKEKSYFDYCANASECNAPDGKTSSCSGDKVCCRRYFAVDQTQHNICSNDGRCVSVPGPGENQCSNNNDCAVSLTVIKQTQNGDGIFTFKNDTDLAAKYLPFGNFTLKTQNGQEQKVFNYSGADIGRSLNIGEKKLPIEWNFCSTDTVNITGTFGAPVPNICKQVGDPTVPFNNYGYYTYCPVTLKNPSQGGQSSYLCAFKNVERKVKLTLKVMMEQDRKIIKGEDRKLNFDLLYNPDSNNNYRDNWQDSFNFDITTIDGKGEKTFEIVPNGKFYIYENLPSGWAFSSPDIDSLGLSGERDLSYYFCSYQDNNCGTCPLGYECNKNNNNCYAPGVRINKSEYDPDSKSISIDYWLPAFKNSPVFYGDRDVTCIFHNEKIKPTKKRLPLIPTEEGTEEIEQLPTGEQLF